MYQYKMPTHLIVGKGCIKQEGQRLRGLGKKAYIVTGRHSSKHNGSLDEVKSVLEQQEIAYSIFDEVEENPSLETIQKAVDQVKEEQIEFVIGIGGGSPIDAAKAIAVLLKSPHLTAETLIGGDINGHLEVVAVPTTAGTGTEATQYAIVTDHKDKTKKHIGHGIFPALAYLDASYMMDMAHDLTVYTAVDAMSHLVESYLNVRSHLLSELYVEKGLGLIGECIDSLLGGYCTFEVREKLLLASALGGMAIAQTGTSIPHGMGYALTYYKGVPHGLANGILYRAYLDTFKDQTKVQQIHQWMGLDSHEALQKILLLLCHQKEISVTEAEIKQYAKEMYQNKAKLMNHPEEITEEELIEIYEKSLVII